MCKSFVFDVNGPLKVYGIEVDGQVNELKLRVDRQQWIGINMACHRHTHVMSVCLST